MSHSIKIHCVEDSTPSPEGTAQLAALQRAVDKALERKRRLGQYAVVWENGQPVLKGEDVRERVVR